MTKPLNIDMQAEDAGKPHWLAGSDPPFPGAAPPFGKDDEDEKKGDDDMDDDKAPNDDDKDE